jgi:3-oxoacyl-[acyl-carrier-protein] synthase II
MGMTDRIAITGVGIVDTLGTSPMECWENMLNENYEHPIDFETDVESLKGLKCFKTKVPEYEIPEGMRKPMHNALTIASKNALHVVQSATQHLDSTDVACVFSSLAAKPETEAGPFVDRMRDGKRLSPRVAVQYLNDFTAGLISQTFDFRGACVSMDAACATGLYSIDYAIHLLNSHKYVVVGGTDTPAVDDDMYLFNQLGALGTKSSPFDKTRDGFIMGEGAGCFLLEKESNALERGANIIGYINSVSHHTDGALGSPTSPDLNMTGAIASMTKATEGIDPDKIAFINAHGTSTPIGDDLEYGAIQQVIPETPVVSFKSKIGHSLASSGINETTYTLMCLWNGKIPKNFNIDDCDLDYVYKYSQKLTKKVAVKNSFAFGGKSSSLVLEV